MVLSPGAVTTLLCLSWRATPSPAEGATHTRPTMPRGLARRLCTLKPHTTYGNIQLRSLSRPAPSSPVSPLGALCVAHVR
eukprot:4256559-Prymnesium_polylepis.1